MARNFANYVKHRTDLDLAIALLETGVDVDAWVQHFTDVARNYQLTESQLYNELMGGLGSMLGAGIRGVGNAFGQAGNDVKRWTGNTVDALGAGVKGVAQRVGNNVAPAIQGAKTAYAQGEIASTLKKIQGLRNVLVNAKVDDPRKIDAFISAAGKYLQNWSQKMNPQTQQQFNFGGQQMGGMSPAT